MGLLDSIYNKIFPPKTRRDRIEREILKAVNKKSFYVSNIKGEKSTYSISYHSEFDFGIMYKDEEAEERYRKKVNKRPVLDENGEHEFHWYTPSLYASGVPSDVNDTFFRKRKVYHWYVDMIPVGITTPNYLFDAPDDLIDAVCKDFETFIKRCISGKYVRTEEDCWKSNGGKI